MMTLTPSSKMAVSLAASVLMIAIGLSNAITAEEWHPAKRPVVTTTTNLCESPPAVPPADLATQPAARPATQRLIEAIGLESKALKLRIKAKEMEFKATKINLDIDRLRGQSMQLEKKIEEQERIADKLESQAQQLRDRTRPLSVISCPGPKVEPPDGEIIWVFKRQPVVFINVGSADFLLPKTRFSVFGSHDGKIVASKRKGKIEVTKITGPHSAEARVLKDDPTDPLVPGDKIDSPVWRPGRQIHFALVGVHDINGDGISDRAKVRDLIHANGGVVDAEVLEIPDRAQVGVIPKERWISGKMNVNTRYMVLGKRPTGKSQAEGLIEAYSSLINKAKSHGVQTMNLQQFLDMMNYKPDEHTEARDDTPLCSAAIVTGVRKANRKEIYVGLSVGTDDGIQKNREFEITRGGVSVGRVKVIHVWPDRCVAISISEFYKRPFEKNDFARAIMNAKQINDLAQGRDADPRKLLPDCGIRIQQGVPSVSTRVTGVRNTSPREIYVGLMVGSDDGIQKGHQFNVTRGGSFVGRVKVIRVWPDRCAAISLRDYYKRPFEKNDLAKTDRLADAIIDRHNR